MNIPQEYLVPYIITNVFSLLLIWVSYKWFRVGRFVFGIIFILASIFNAYTVTTAQESYMNFGKNVLLYFYSDFIFGPFRDHIILYVIIISVLQMFMGLCMFLEGYFEKYGIIGGIIFLVLIAPLGIGSAFPTSLFMALALLIINQRRLTEIRKKMMY